MNAVINAIKHRRSIRAYLPRQLEPEVLDAILDAGLYAPSARNTQSAKLVVVQGEKLKRLDTAIKEAIMSGSLPYPRAVADDYQSFYGAPTVVIACDLKSRPLQLSLCDCACILQTIFLAAESLGVGSCWINQVIAGSDIPEVRAVLNECDMPEDYTAFGSAALGYAAGEPAPHAIKSDRIIK